MRDGALGMTTHLELVVVLHLLQNLQLLRTRLEPHQAPQRRAASFGGIHARHLRGLHFSPPLEQLQRALGVGQACRVLSSIPTTASRPLPRRRQLESPEVPV